MTEHNMGKELVRLGNSIVDPYPDFHAYMKDRCPECSVPGCEKPVEYYLTGDYGAKNSTEYGKCDIFLCKDHMNTLKIPEQYIIKENDTKGITMTKSYNIMEEFPFGNVIWAVNPEKETVTCILRKNKNEMEILKEILGIENCLRGIVKVYTKYVATSKPHHEDKFDVQVGMGLSLMKVMIKAGMTQNITSMTKLRKINGGQE